MDRPGMRTRPKKPDWGDRSEWIDPLPPAQQPAHKPTPDYSYADSDVFDRMIDRSRVRRWYQLPSSRRRWVPALIGFLAASAVLVTVFLLLRSAPAPAPTAAPNPSPPARPALTPTAECPARSVGNIIQGNGQGGADSGPAVILAFQYAYYVSRSSELARTVVAPDAAVSPAPEIQQGIDTIPAGTTHCVTITPGAFAGQYLVRISEYRPGIKAVAYNAQLVTTARSGDQTLITAIAAAQ
ncbi:hypothetical protein [Nocardia australiensis]|uniref:hypothetical protein n=1 Tax=Nocardia australiensis TaxID=2887191 RepID=UPI001D13805A|nr:hypothetical protein [Nocardia australiensis]